MSDNTENMNVTPMTGEFGVLTQRSDTEPRGNTRARGWAMTIFSEEELEAFKTLEGVRYRCAGNETCPDTGRQHYQCYIYFNNARTFNALKKKLKTTHMEVTKGTGTQNRDYCKKDGDFWEEGDLPTQGRISAEKLKSMSDEEIIDANARCHRALINARNIMQNKMTVKEWGGGKDVKVNYFYGESGCGKSTKVAEDIAEKYGEEAKVCLGSYANGFYNLSDPEAEHLIMDDWRDSDMKPSEFVKLIDYRIQVMNIKGGSVMNRFKNIYITSVRPIHKIYANMRRRDEHMEQWTRRMNIEHLCIDDDCKCDEEEEDPEWLDAGGWNK